MLSKLLSRPLSALVCTFSLLATASLAQTTIHVGAGQTYATIQSGINAANAGDTVLVAPGTYNENIDFKGKAITVTSSDGAAKTIIDGGSKDPAVSFVTNETAASTISGFTIQHGGNFGIGLPAGSAPVYPGGIYLQSSSPTILNNIITLNNCWGVDSQYSAPTIRNNTISATQGPNGDCSFGGGAAILVWGGINGQYNRDGINSGVIYGNTIENNVESGLEDAGGNGGAAIAVWGGTVVIQDNILRNNASPGGSGGAINLESSSNSLIVQNLIYGNSSGCGGGAIATDGQGLNVINNTIVDNVFSSFAGYSNCAEIAQIYPGPGLYGGDNPSDVFLNNIISGSTSYPAVNCDSLGSPSEAGQPTFQNNILYNAGGPFFGSYCVDVSDKYNNIAADPQFTDPANHNYTLKSTSPAIDHGQNSVLQTVQSITNQFWTKDFAGNPRVADVTGNGCNIDIGAYEYPSTRNDCGVSETLVSSLNPAVAGQGVTFTAQLTAQAGTPTGLIEFFDGTALLGSQAVSSTGSAAFATSALTVGTHTITANYQPTGNFGASTASLTQVITGSATTTGVTCSPATIDVYGTAQLTARVTSTNGTPTGSVAFADNTTVIATQALTKGATTLTYTGTTAGSHNIIATYEPTGSFAQSAAANCSEIVNALPTTSTLTVAPSTSTYGSPITLSATVAQGTQPAKSTPTGTVMFYNSGSLLGTGTLANGVATLTTSGLPGGTNSLTCRYSGSSIYAPSDCNPVLVTIHAAPTTLTLTSSKNPSAYPNTVSLTAHLTVNGHPATAGNAVELTLNAKSVLLTTDATGSATYNTGALPPASYPVTASFAATNDLLASSASLTEVITAAPTTITMTASPNPGDLNQPVTLAATVSSPGISSGLSGTVTFYDGSATLGSSAVTTSGTASLTTSFSALGVHNLTAIYSGSQEFTTSTSPVFQETIIAGDFSIAVTPGAATLYTGQSTSAKISVASLRGFNQSLGLSCIGLPADTTCTFSPASFSNGQGAATLVIQTSAPQKVAANSSPTAGPATALAALTLFLIPGLRRRRRLLAGLSTVLLAIAFILGASGCGAPAPIAGCTPPGIYPIAVAATTADTSLSHSATITLTVKSLF